jgi:hypothetical protein
MIERAFKHISRIISPEDDDEKMWYNLRSVWIIVDHVLQEDPNLEEHLAERDEFFDNVKRKGEQDFFKSLRDMKKDNSWERLFDDDVFIKPLSKRSMILSAERAWISTFRGNAHLVLLETIADLLDRNRNPYARLTNIINSSGTGKSRTVDQLGKKIITVPMCLRSESTEGFPPSDSSLRHWLVFGDSSYQCNDQRRLNHFVYALLIVTRTTLETIVTEGKDVPPLPDLNDRNVRDMSEIEREKHASCVKDRQAWLASTFRNLMTTGQSSKFSNTYRKKFYDDVIKLANQREESREGGNVEGAGEMLCRFVDPCHLLDSVKGPRRPLVVFALDEAHVLTDNRADDSWDLFSELRRILRQIYDLPIFWLFISTAGRFNQFYPWPMIGSDPSNRARVRNSNPRPLVPISEISFDDLAYPALENTVALGRVVQIDWMSHLGRPLFGSHWDAMEPQRETVLLDIARWKLLNGPTHLAKNNRPGSLACLCVRFALEFDVDGTALDVACAQVERHMRICVAATYEFETFITVAGSEPLLAEAAYELMKESKTNAVCHLADHPDLHCVERGRRGELVATTLIMHAYDEARRPASDNQRWVSVSAFMKALLPPTEYDTLLKCRPTFWRTREDKPFDETFQDYGMWFNHVIKIEDTKMISADNLWKFVTRGAMVLLSNYQDGLDIVLPLCDTKQNLSRDSMTAILIQVKNAERFKKDIQESLFVAMSPFDLGVFPEEGTPTTVTPKPVIRLVLALASPEAGVAFREEPERESDSDTFTAFDIWLAGLSEATFGKIGDDLVSYQYLLDRSLRPHDAFELTDDSLMSDATKKLRGDCRRRMASLALSDN